MAEDGPVGIPPFERELIQLRRATDEELISWLQDCNRARAEHANLRAEIARLDQLASAWIDSDRELVEIAQEVASSDPAACVFTCAGHMRVCDEGAYTFVHAPSCAVTKARAVLARLTQ